MRLCIDSEFELNREACDHPIALGKLPTLLVLALPFW